MAGKRGALRLAAVAMVLIVACVLAYFLLLEIVRPHTAAGNGGYVVVPHNSSANEVGIGTPEQMAGADTGGADSAVSFFQLPLWIQLYALPGILIGAIASFGAAVFVVRRTRKSNNPNKREVFTYITDNPGCTAPELARDEYMNIGTVRYYVQCLEAEGRIVLRKIGKFNRIFVNSHTYDDREKLIASYLRSDSSRQILSALMDTPGITNQRLSDKLGIEKSLVYRYMQKLLDDGIVTFEWEGNNKLYYISQGAKEPLIKLMPRNYQCPGLMKE
ncbi:MAG TPA: winged helix-turn-helix transcriptional regulator [Methanocella sp.]|uniref:winged helix-turn-helix transcriptional regulator n=1 Tax=Methanocella sp. TaxID=2052833 RepID=UPI002BF5D789|nr:winged helix-turn-helix transcriptional regulator [Methanocella sp.]HTY90564.1 winged helix-turn-helix transcriptional regulator [Methanocella sp.]